MRARGCRVPEVTYLEALRQGLREEMLTQIENEFAAKKKQIDAEFSRQQQEIRQKQVKTDVVEGKKNVTEDAITKGVDAATELKLQQLKTLQEAVELAKKYSTEDSGKFVNGVLAAYLRDKEK